MTQEAAQVEVRKTGKIQEECSVQALAELRLQENLRRRALAEVAHYRAALYPGEQKKHQKRSKATRNTRYCNYE